MCVCVPTPYVESDLQFSSDHEACLEEKSELLLCHHLVRERKAGGREGGKEKRKEGREGEHIISNSLALNDPILMVAMTTTSNLTGFLV